MNRMHRVTEASTMRPWRERRLVDGVDLDADKIRYLGSD
jgi:hypothetical protein